MFKNGYENDRFTRYTNWILCFYHTVISMYVIPWTEISGTVPAWDLFFFFWLNQSSDTLRSADCRFFVLIQTWMISLATTWVLAVGPLQFELKAKKLCVLVFSSNTMVSDYFYRESLILKYVSYVSLKKWVTGNNQNNTKNNNSIYLQNIHWELCSF